MMHDPSLHSRSCVGKKGFHTWKEAERAMRSVIRRSGAGGDHMSVYRCRYCPDYHFGHDNQKLKT
jgi:hypothetical protein